jgi:hypothetical protein
VVHARVIAQRMARGGPDQAIYTISTLAVLEDFTGQPGDVIEVWELGGVIGNERLYVGGAVNYVVGREVVVCLERGPLGYRSIAMGFSKFDVASRAGGAALLRRSMGSTHVVGGQPASRERTLDEFRQIAAAATGHPSRRIAQAAAPAESNVEQPYTFFGNGNGVRWIEADSGTPISWYRNTSAAPPVSGNGVSEIQTALSAWTAPPSASITLQYAGTTSQSLPKGPWTGLPSSGIGVITFEDPQNELSGLTLAIAGGFVTAGAGGTVGGVTFDAFVTAYVIFQNAADLDPEFKVTLGFSRVLEHEIGHGIGLGHTDDDFFVIEPEANIMNSSCCYDETPVPPALGPDDLAGVTFIYPDGPPMTVDKASLNFGAVTTGAAFVSQTSAQIVRLTQSGPGTVTWTATPTEPWLQVTPSSGTGSANLSVSIVYDAGLPPNGSDVGSIVFSFIGSGITPGPISVNLKLFANGTSASPIVNVDTPIDNQTGVTGAIPFTGWAIDDVEVASVAVCRAAFGAEVAPIDPNCGGQAQIFIGFGVFIEGARPDVASVYSTLPANTKAGWGLQVLTNMLPSQGNGLYVFSMWAKDRDGHTVPMGTRTMTCANASATKPFGAIDTPTQGGVASGASFVNFGWALTPQPKTIPTNGSTIQVLIDGNVVGNASYNQFRSDIAGLFPGLNNTNGAVGYRRLDTTALTNGSHTIAWVVTDDQGAAEGIGSRFFTVSNGTGALTAAPLTERQMTATSARAPRRSTSLVGRRGWKLDAPLQTFPADADGSFVVQSEEVSRVELHLEPGTRGYLRTHAGLSSLPIGAQLDARSGLFTWAPGVGYVGDYELEFVGRDQSAKRVHVVLQPKTSGAIGPQVVIDTPRAQQDVGQPFELAGWAVDLSASQGTGIGTLHAWAYPLAGGPPIFVGATAMGGLRSDVAAVHGAQFEASGFGLTIQGLTPGNYDLAVFAWSTERAGFAPAKVVRITVR